MANERVIDSGISVKHAKAWTTSEAVREVYQNWLDVRSEYGCEGQLSYDMKRGYVYVADAGPGMKVEHLAFGNNDKATGSIGQFGEGLKSAFVALVRDNKRIEIRSQSMLIIPFFAMSESFGVETLHYKILPCAEFVGTKIRVWCSKEEAENAKSYFCKLDKGFHWYEEGKISQPGGKVYVNGSKIGDLQNSLFSYHLEGDDAAKAINRDRNAVDMNIVKPMLESILNHTKSVKVAEMVLRQLTVYAVNTGPCFEQDLRLYSYHDKVWLMAWHRIYTQEWILPSELESNTAVGYRGYKILRNISGQMEYFLSSFGVKTANEILKAAAAKKASIGVVANKDLTTVERDNLNWAIMIVTKYYTDPGKVVIGTNLSAAVGTIGDNRMIGCRDNDKSRTILAREILTDRKQTLHTLLHETVHMVSAESDLTSEFEHALLDVSVKIIMNENPEPIVLTPEPEPKVVKMHCFMCSTDQDFVETLNENWRCPNCDYVRSSCTPLQPEQDVSAQ